MKRVYNQEMIDWLIANYPALGIAECAKHLGLLKSQVVTKARELYLKQNPERKFMSASEGWKNRERNFRVDPNQFFNVKTPEAAYFLGFLWADGYLGKGIKEHRIAIEIKTSDFICLEPLLKKIGKWSICHRQRENRSPQSAATTNNKPLHNFLADKGYRAKSNQSACSIINHVPIHLRNYWFRGLIDGDGHIDKSGHLGISSGFNQDWEYMIDICKKIGINYSIRKWISKLGHGASEFRMTKRAESIYFLDWVYHEYPNDKIGLDRKYSTYIECSKPKKSNWIARQANNLLAQLREKPIQSFLY